jgi:sn-glycerol 3-phosphate transport system ATP-binding protein
MNLLKHAPGTPDGQILGIRPEHLDITPTAQAGGWTLIADTVELLGAERLVHARLGDEILTLRLDESVTPPSPGQNFGATPRADRLHWFDAATEKRISLP